MCRDPAGDALAELDLELFRCLVDVLADLALHGDRDEVLAVQPIDPGVVEVEQLAQLGRDGEADLLHAREPVESGPELLDRLELGRPGRHLAVVLGRADGHRCLRREGRHGVELVLGPRVRPIVVDVEQAEQVGAVEQGRRAQGVEAFLDHRRAHRTAARVVRIADGEQRPTSRHGRARQGWGGEVADRREVFGRQPIRHLGDDPAVALAEEQGDPVGLEQDRRVIHQAGQGLIEIEPAADVSGHPPQRIEAVELLRGVLHQPGRIDTDGELARDRVEEFEIPLGEPIGGVR